MFLSSSCKSSKFALRKSRLLKLSLLKVLWVDFRRLGSKKFEDIEMSTRLWSDKSELELVTLVTRWPLFVRNKSRMLFSRVGESTYWLSKRSDINLNKISLERCSSDALSTGATGYSQSMSGKLKSPVTEDVETFIPNIINFRVDKLHCFFKAC